MTVAQLASYAKRRIITSDISFDTPDTQVKFIYLGQHIDKHFFMLSIKPVKAEKRINAKAVKDSVKVLDDIGFEDLHWKHFDETDEGSNLYMYFTSITNDKLIML